MLSGKGLKDAGKSASETREFLHTLDDLNQPLSAIDNYVQAGRRLMDKGYADEEKLAQLFDKLAGQVSRCHELARELQQTVKHQKLRGGIADRKKPK